MNMKAKSGLLFTEKTDYSSQHLCGQQLISIMSLEFTGNIHDLTATPSGRPIFLNYPYADFNISHSRNLAACTITAEGITGCDIQYMRRRTNLKTAERCFHHEELQDIDETRYYMLWTLKEAFLKMHGMGVSEINRSPVFTVKKSELLISGYTDSLYAAVFRAKDYMLSMIFSEKPALQNIYPYYYSTGIPEFKLEASNFI